MNIYNSRVAKHFVRHQGMVSISTMRFGLRTGLSLFSFNDTVKHSGKDHEKNFKSLVAVSTLHKLEYIFVICKWPYLVIPMSRVLCHTTKDRHRSTRWDAQTLFLNLKASLYEHSKSVTLELSCQPEKSI